MSLNKITLDDRELYCEDDESLLDALIRANVEIAHNCRQGRCHNCLVRCLQGTPPPGAQKGLREALRHQNYFLACRCFPQQDVAISLKPVEDCFTEATVIGKRLLNIDTMLVSVRCKAALDHYAGQFVNLKRGDGLTRSYAIANSRIHGEKLSFHIRRLAGGRFSEWVHQELNIGDSIAVSEPQGLCYYWPGDKNQGLLLIGTGSGLAPLAAIAAEALHQGHAGPVHLYHGGGEMDGLYWIDEMMEMASQYANFHYTPCVSRGDAPAGVAAGRANNVAMADMPSLKGWRVYLSGHPEMVDETKRMAMLKGAWNQDIYTEAFHFASSTLD
ncbi:2Fe-2S iron-sulfur cluster binding domain-containing protein [Methylomonas montana]|uniref:2Fe-2S iron-sulfur cluster binding domain-containing protein n=1 Tax=Methylomonas montana TaxID=3058963 RepID=UPI00265B71F5|nr:2Fe-2S iron-sulfur cluster binding domain-containing protein [Methylomonas montana]WKJ90777.1 2Fe-2S iron-sulfur cluster binding domain-containing protein [Methylomonas montana]